VMTFAFSRVSGALAAFVLSTVLFNASAAHANIVFDFSGECASGCTGTATGVLTLADSYTFGANLTVPDFISFTYTSSDRDFTITQSNLVLPGWDGRPLFGGLNANGSLNAIGIFNIIPTSTFPLFEVDADGFKAFKNIRGKDKGSTFSFRREITTTSPGGGAVPEPSTWAMMLLGFAGLGFAGYRAKRNGRGLNGVSKAH
jgi:PEP-CTERM motif